LGYFFPCESWKFLKEDKIFDKMKKLKIIILITVLAMGLKAQADGLYDITFTDGGVNVGAGQIDVESGLAVSGYFDVTAGIAAGSFSLYTAGGNIAYPGQLTSPAEAFLYDNAIYLTTNPQYPTTNPFLDMAGLLFTDVSGNEINLWGNSDGTYTFYGDINHNRYDPQVVGESTIAPAVAPAPEPSSIAIIALMLVPAGVYLRRKIAFQK
jgi:hypothetical protein